MGDLIGATLFPSGPYFPGYTLSSTLSGLIYGLFLYKKSSSSYTNKQFIIRLIISSLIVIVLVYMGFNSLWLYLTSNMGIAVFAPIRIIKQLVMFPVQVIIIFLLEKFLQKPMDKYLRD